jgi:tetratricopeptide (TPR) repeat protein/DNA-binding transcriptional ArsR family regulator
MSRPGVDDRIDLVAKRVDLLEALAAGPRYKPALVEATGDSRSTVDRAIRDLEAAGLAERTDEGFRATLAGRLAAERYRAFVAEETSVLDAVGFLRSLPHDCDLPFEAVRESRTETVGSPARAFEVTAEPLRTAARYAAFLPELRDSRHLRLAHARVRGDGTALELLVTDRVLERLRTEFPRLAADLATSDGVYVWRVTDEDARPYALFLARADGAGGVEAEADGPTVSVVSTTGEESGVLTATAPSAVEWAEATLASLRADATDVTEDLAALVDDLDGTPLGRHERRGPSGPSAVGFERVDRGSLSGRTPNDPVTGWRVGFDLVDAYYGHPFERHHRPEPVEEDGAGTTAGAADGPPDADSATPDGTDAGPTRAVEYLYGVLVDGTNAVVLGPSGSGKSTLCRQVACRWVADGHGPVLYRSTPNDAGFDHPEPLLRALEAAEGHALVVVEDGERAATVERLAPVIERARDDPGVSVLLESRTDEWPPAGVDPRTADLLRTAVTGYRLGGLSEAEVRDAVDAFEAATGRTVPRSAADLFETLDDGDGPGDCHLLGYLLAAYTTPTPWSDTAAEPTGLDADARAAYGAVAPEGSDGTTVPLEVALLAAAVTVAGQAVTPAALHTVAAAHADAGDDGAHRRVDAAVDDLRGVLLFDRGTSGGGPDRTDTFRTQHPYWAARFLEGALEAGDRTTVDAFERAVSALFATADDTGVRERIESWFGRPLPDLDRFEADVDGAVEGLFGAVRRYTSLVPLFGTTAFSGIRLPAACSPATRLEARAARLYGWYKYGDLDRAESEAEGLLAAVGCTPSPADVDGPDRPGGDGRDGRTENLDGDGRDGVAGSDREVCAGIDGATAVRFEARARRRLADVADDRGDPEAAREHLRAGLSAVRGSDDPHPREETRLLTSLGMVELHADAYEAAEEYLREADRAGEGLGPSPERSATLYYLGRLHRKRGEYAAAEERLGEALEVDRQCESLPPSDAAATLNALGTVAVDRGAHERAESYYRQALELQREANNRRGVATTLVNLGDLAVETGDPDVAASCFEEALEIAADVGVSVVHGAALSGLGRVAAARGDLEAAEAYHRERTTVDGSPRSLAVAERYLGDVDAERGDLGAARTHYEAAAEAFVELGAVDRAAATALDLVEACAEAGARADARAWVDRLRELTDDAGLGEYREAAAAWDDRLASE